METINDSKTSFATDSDDHNSVVKKSPKRRRDADQRILDQFWVICDSNQLKRNKSLKLIIEILVKQKETNGSNDLMYCVDRVIRGMASARQFARHGFCVLLTQLLSIFKSEISLELVYSLSAKHLGKVEDMSNHDSVIGWSLVVASVLQSQRLTPDVEEDIWKKSFDVLYTLGMNKQYIELVVCQLILDFMLLLTDKTVFEEIVLNRLEVDLKSENKLKPFFIFICLLVLDQFPKFVNKKVKFNFIFKAENLQKLSLLIKESTAYQPSVHPMNRLIIKHFITKTELNFSEFWQKSIDETLFTPNQIEKGLLGFELIKISLPLMTSVENVPTVLSPSFLRLFIQSLSVKTHPLNSASQQLCQFFIDFMKSTDNSDLQLEIVDCFTKQPGSLLFDEISKSKFFTNLTKSLNTESIRKWTQKLKTIFLTTNKVDSNDIYRIRCLQQISSLCKAITSSEDFDILWSNIKFFFFNAYFVVDDNYNPKDQILNKPLVAISDRLRDTLKDGFRSTFNHLTHLGSKTSKEKLICEVETHSSLLEFVNELMATKNITPLTDSKFQTPFKAIVKRVSRLQKRLDSKGEKQNEIRIFVLLYSMFAIQLFEELEEIENILPDLNECMKRAIDGQSEDLNDSSPGWADVLTDLILSMLTTPSKLTKNVLFSCFKHISSNITTIGLQRLVDAISTSNDNKLFAGNDDSDEDEEEDQEEEEGEEDKSESESESSSDENVNQNNEIDEQFRNDVMNALGPAAQNDEDEESVYLSDSEMFQIDETLAEVFRTKYNDKKESIEKQKSIVVFRVRCLELIQIFLNHKNVDLDQVFQFIQPIVSIARSSSQPSKPNPLSSKSIQAIQQIIKIKDSNNNSIEIKDLKQVLDNLIKIMNKSIHLELQKTLNALSIWIVQIGKKLFPDDDWYLEVIESALKVFFEKNNCQISSTFFKSLITVHQEIGVKLFDLFLENAFSEDIRPFVKSVAIETLFGLCKTQLSKNNSNLLPNKQIVEIREKTMKVLSNELNSDKLRAQYVTELLRLFELTDKCLKVDNNKQKVSENDIQEISQKLKALSKQKRKKLISGNRKNKQFIKSLILSSK